MNKTIGWRLSGASGIASRLFAACVGIAATFAAPLSSQAQSVAASSGGLEEIVVTANKLNARVGFPGRRKHFLRTHRPAQ